MTQQSLIPTICPYCGVGCGLYIASSAERFSASDVSSASLFSPFANGIGLAPIPGRSTAGALVRTAPHRKGVPG